MGDKRKKGKQGPPELLKQPSERPVCVWIVTFKSWVLTVCVTDYSKTGRRTMSIHNAPLLRTVPGATSRANT